MIFIHVSVQHHSIKFYGTHTKTKHYLLNCKMLFRNTNRLCCVQRCAGSGKHLILSILSKTTNIDFTYIDESITLDAFENMCKRQNLLDFLGTDNDVKNATTPYFVFEECHVNNKHSVLLNANYTYKWPCMLLITTQHNAMQ